MTIILLSAVAASGESHMNSQNSIFNTCSVNQSFSKAHSGLFEQIWRIKIIQPIRMKIGRTIACSCLLLTSTTFECTLASFRKLTWSYSQLALVLSFVGLFLLRHSETAPWRGVTTFESSWSNKPYKLPHLKLKIESRLDVQWAEALWSSLLVPQVRVWFELATQS